MDITAKRDFRMLDAMHVFLVLPDSEYVPEQ
jgi:hypothetical protein